MQTTNYKKITLLLAVLLSITAVKAQDMKNLFNPEVYGVTSLAIAPDARGGSMGDIGAATEADVFSQYWNPAKYPFNVARAGVGVSYTPWLRKLVGDINLANVAGFYRIGDYSAVSASLRYFSLGEVYLGGDEFGDMTIKPYEMAIDVGYSRMLSQCFSMGVNLRFVFSDISYDYRDGSSPGKAFAADIAMYRLGYLMLGNRECSLGWGINISNIGSKISFGGSDVSEFLPTNLRIGLNFTVPFNEYNKISLAIDANKFLIPTYPRDEEGNPYPDNSEEAHSKYYDISPIAGIFKSFGDAPGGFKEEMQEIRWSFGAEYTYNDRFMLRAGYHHEAETKGNRKYFTVGAGFHMSVFTVDASYCISTAQSNPLDQTMRFSLGFDLDGMRDLFGKMKRRR
ncbi:MAG: type IX secretion system outer membrane channel protein PorV [Bacteroidaceae bacterium]|nr:type IX secretion system outer membrane channel protein PorV [Bacteroidaceae bacterium]